MFALGEKSRGEMHLVAFIHVLSPAQRESQLHSMFLESRMLFVHPFDLVRLAQSWIMPVGVEVHCVQ